MKVKNRGASESKNAIATKAIIYTVKDLKIAVKIIITPIKIIKKKKIPEIPKLNRASI